MTLKLTDWGSEHGIYIKKIDGLGPPKADVRFKAFSSMDGSSDNGAVITQRDITITLGLVEKNTIEESRLRVYRYFPIKSRVTIIVKTDHRNVSIEGVVESNTPDIFNKSESVVISIRCPYPYFYEYEESSSVSFYDVIPLFEFPFPNEFGDLNEFGEILRRDSLNLVYDGDIDTGVIIRFYAATDVNVNFSIANETTKEAIFIDMLMIEKLTGNPIKKGDELVVSTLSGNKKSATLVRQNGQRLNVLNALIVEGGWIHLQMGDNLFSMSTDAIQCSIEYRKLYEGV